MAARDRALTVRLDEEEFARLQAEATRLGIRPGALARIFVRGGLQNDAEDPALADALGRLRRRASRLPGVDAVRVATKARRQLAAADPV